MVREFAGGAGLLVRGFGLVAGRRRLFLLGALPPLITSVIFLALLITLITNLDGLVPAITGFAGGWPAALRDIIQVAVGTGLVGGSVLIMVLVFSAFTLLIGSPAYDKIAEHTDAELGPLPDVAELPWTASAARSVRQSLGLVVVSLAGSLAFVLLGLIPVVGQMLIPVLSAIFGSWMLTIELLGPAFERRGLLRLADRRAAMGRRRARTLGFAIPTFLLMAIPFLAILVLPAATAGGTMLARDLLGSGR
jgi:CysZ protein